MSAVRCLRLVSRLYPRGLRDELLEDMLGVFERERRRIRAARGRLAAHAFSLRTIVSAIGQGLGSRLGDSGRRLGGVGGGDGRGGAGHHVRHALSALRAAPGHVVVTVLTLGLGVGISAALYTLVDQVMLEPLPHPGGERLVRVWRTLPQFDWRRAPVSLPTFEDWVDQAGSFDVLGAYSPAIPVTWLGGDYPERISAGYLTDSLLPMLGIRPSLGAVPAAGQGEGASPPALVTESFWRSRLGADPDVVGRTLEIEGLQPIVTGVLPSEVGLLPAGVDVWMPAAAASQAAERDASFLQAVARLRAGASVAEAQAEMEAIAQRVAEAHPDAANGSGVWIEPQRAFLLRDVGTLLRLLGACALLVLAIVCASLTGLTLTRVYGRSQELAVRAALGATAGRVGRQLLVESLLVGIVGAAVGALVAHGLLDVLLAYGPRDLPRRTELAFDGGTLAFVVLVGLGSSLLIGLLPAVRAVHVARSGAALRGGHAGAAERGGPGGHRALRLLAAGQVGLSTVLLIVAALLTHSFLRLAAVDPGFATDDRLSAQVALPNERYPDSESARAFFARLLERAVQLPGVRAAGAAWALPFRPTYGSGTYTVEGQPAPEGTELLIGLVPVAGDYFRAMGVPIRRGRAFTDRDIDGAVPVAIVNETMARRHWPQADPLGRQFRRGETAYTIVGVVPDVKRESLAEESLAEAYLPFAQVAWANDLYVVLHTEGDPAALAGPLRAVLHEMDPGLPATAISPLSELVAETLTGPRFRVLLIGGFAAFAAFLALLGVYGVVRLAVASRTAEIGLRIALGAGRGRTQREVVSSGLRVALAGVAVGVPTAWAASGTIETLVFGIAPTDPKTYAVVVAALVAVVALASWLPARWASRIDPVIALRR